MGDINAQVGGNSISATLGDSGINVSPAVGAGGDIIGVVAGLGLTGGGDVGSVTLALDTTYLNENYATLSHTHEASDITDFGVAVTSITDLLYSQLGHTHTAGQITDFDTSVSANIDVSANTSARHSAITLGTNTAAALGLSEQVLSINDVFVQISGDVMEGQLKIDGTSDTVHLIIEAYSSQTENLIELVNSADVPYISIGPPSIGGQYFSNHIGVDTTLSFPTLSAVASLRVDVTTDTVTTTTTNSRVAAAFRLLNGFAASPDAPTITLQAINQAIGKANDLKMSQSITPSGNSGINARVTGVSVTGLNIAGAYGAEGGALNVAVLGKAPIDKAGSVNIGVLANGRNTLGTSIGGWFTLGSSTPTWSSAALVADNASLALPIMRFKDNGADVMIVQDGGVIDFLWSMGNSTEDPRVTAPTDWIEIKIGGTTRYLPAYAA